MNLSPIIFLLSGFGVSAIISFMIYRRKTQSAITQISNAINALCEGKTLEAEKKIPKNFYKLIPVINDLAKRFDLFREAIRCREDESAIIFDHLREGVIVMNRNQKILTMNQSARNLFEIGSEFKSKNLIEIVKNEQIVNAAIEAIEKQVQKTIAVELRHPKKVDLKLCAIGIKAAAEIAGILIVYDVTEINQLERVRKDFVANVSHELKTPLTSIKGFIETMLMNDTIDTVQARKFLAIMKEDSDRLERLIHDILELSKIESRESSGKIESVSLGDLITETLNLLNPQIQSKQITIERHFDKSDCKIRGKQDQLMQVFINLIDNAIKYNRAGGKIIINLKCLDGYVKILITDTGVGISEDKIGRIFERFFRVDPARSRELGGTGLGLAIVKHIIEAHQGKIECTSQLNRETTFTVTFPIL